MSDPSKVHEYIDSLIACHYTMIKYLKEIHAAMLIGEPAMKPLSVSPDLALPPEPVEDSEFTKLKQALQSDKWSQAANPRYICDPESEIDRVERGRGIIGLMLGDNELVGKKLLDIGCETGHAVVHAALEKGASKAVGYDIKDYGWNNLPKHDNLLFTLSKDEVAKAGPYDAILLFDVIDHVKNETPHDLLKMAADLLAPDGRVYMRCHPWTSRHAHHNYLEINKAYIHLVFTPEELREIWPEAERKYYEPNIGVTTPFISYGNLVRGAGLEIIGKAREIKENVDSFFKIPMIAQRIMANTGHQSFPEFQLTIQFLDFTLRKPQ